MNTAMPSACRGRRDAGPEPRQSVTSRSSAVAAWAAEYLARRRARAGVERVGEGARGAATAAEVLGT